MSSPMCTFISQHLGCRSLNSRNALVLRRRGTCALFRPATEVSRTLGRGQLPLKSLGTPISGRTSVPFSLTTPQCKLFSHLTVKPSSCHRECPAFKVGCHSFSLCLNLFQIIPPNHQIQRTSQLATKNACVFRLCGSEPLPTTLRNSWFPLDYRLGVRPSSPFLQTSQLALQTAQPGACRYLLL